MQTGYAYYRNGSAPVSRKFVHLPDRKEFRVQNYFELYLVNGKLLRLRGSTNHDTSKWMLLIRQALKAFEAKKILHSYEAQLVYQGWMKRIKGSSSYWLWCKLMGPFLIYFKSSQTREPLGYKALKNAHIQIATQILNEDTRTESIIKTSTLLNNHHVNEMMQTSLPYILTSSSDSDSVVNDSFICQKTIKIWSNTHDAIYFICQNENELHVWRDHLIRACFQIEGFSKAFVHSSQVLQKLCNSLAQIVRVIHRDRLFHTAHTIGESMLDSLNPEHNKLSLKMFDQILFLSHPYLYLTQISGSSSSTQKFDTSQAHFLYSSEWQTMKHVVIKNLTQMCFDYPQLKDELYLQLIKQTIFISSNVRKPPKEAFTFPHRARVSRRGFSLLCTKSHETQTDMPNIASTLLEDKMDQSYLNRFKFNLKNSSLNAIITQYASPNKLILPSIQTMKSNLTETWWPLLAVWECLCLILPLFLPSEPVVHCLDYLFQLFSNPDWFVILGLGVNSVGDYDEYGQNEMDIYSEIKNYAAFCAETLLKTKCFGGREVGPSALEVATISLRNPYTHAFPFSIPVHLSNGLIYEVVSFHGGSVVEEITKQMMEKLNLMASSWEQVVICGLYLEVEKVG